MLSYRHAYHAGNFADVLKHLILVRLLRHLAAKERPLRYLETHAGAGRYALASPPASQNREFATGIGRLWSQRKLPDALADYVDLVRQCNRDQTLRHYPGSPWFALRLLRPNDRLVLHERHPAEIGPLRRLCAGDRRVRVEATDGYDGLIATLPPPERRGLSLIDPSYELPADFGRVVATLRGAHRRFATGTYAVWYPVVDRRWVERLQRALIATGIPDIQLYELCVRPDAAGRGLTGSGMVIVNPPWTLADEMRATLPWLVDILAQPGGGPRPLQRIVTLAPE